MVSEFKWPSTIPSGQRTYRTPSCLIRKTIKSIKLLRLSDNNTIDLLDETNGFNEISRLTLISGALGAFCGIKNSLYAGYVVAARQNRESLENFDNSYKLFIEWNSEGKKNLTCAVYDLVEIVDHLSYVLEIASLFSPN